MRCRYNDCRRDLDVEAYVEHEDSKTELEDTVVGAKQFWVTC